VFDLSASDNLTTPSVPIGFPVSVRMKRSNNSVHLRLSEVSDVFDLSVSANLIAPPLVKMLSVE
jgi:hypothetical protein